MTRPPCCRCVLRGPCFLHHQLRHRPAGPLPVWATVARASLHRTGASCVARDLDAPTPLWEWRRSTADTRGYALKGCGQTPRSWEGLRALECVQTDSVGGATRSVVFGPPPPPEKRLCAQECSDPPSPGGVTRSGLGCTYGCIWPHTSLLLAAWLFGRVPNMCGLSRR